MEKNDNKWLTTDEMMALLMSEPDREMEFTLCLGGLLRSTHWCLAFYDFYMSRLLLSSKKSKRPIVLMPCSSVFGLMSSPTMMIF